MKPVALLSLKYRSSLLVSMAIAGGVMALRLLGVLQTFELQAFDRMIQLRPIERSDHRIVIVGISDTDLQRLGRNEISDEKMAALIREIKRYKPRAIGLDFYRNLPIEPGHAALQEVFRTTPNLIGIQKVVNDQTGHAVAGNPVLVAANQVAASDIIPDEDGRVRRALLFPSVDSAKPLPGLGFKLALDYLQSMGIQPNANPAVLTFATARFPPFGSDDGGYVRADDGGYQILLNLRASARSFQRVSMMDVLEGAVSPELMTDKIVMIGSTLPGNSDAFYTAYSNSFGMSAKPMYGVELHAHITSQILSAVLDGRPVLTVFPEWLEIVWIGIAGVLGVWVQWNKGSDVRKAGLTVVLVGGLVVGSYLLLLYGWWFPVVPVSLAFLGASGLMMASNARQLHQLSTRDELTQLANRRTFNEGLEREWYRALRSQTPLALILCDVDYFKRYNDTYGHPQGDECLRLVAKALKRATLRSSDLVARYGGEEFVMLLPNTDLDAALKVAENARAHLKTMNIPHASSDVSDAITLSLGITCIVPTIDIAPSMLVKTADLGLYEAKQKGRNQAIAKLP